MSAEPSNLTPLMFLAVFQFRRGIGVPCQRPGDPAVESLARTPCVSRAQQGDLFTAGTEFS